MNHDLFEQKINVILNKGKCPKVVLFDEESLQIFSNLVPHSKFVEHDFFLFDLISNKLRDKISKVTCFVIVRPINYELLMEELSSPHYSEYILLFTNAIDENVLKVIAEWDISSVVIEVYEIFIDVFKQEDGLYTLNFSNNVFPHESIQDLRRTCDGLISIFRTLNFLPTIHVQSNSEVSKMIGIEVSSRLSPLGLKEGCQLIVIDRKFDLITPLIHNWTFISMIDEYLKFENGIVSINGKAHDLCKHDIYKELRFKDINRASQIIKKFVSSIETKKVSKDTLECIEEKSKKSEIIETLLAIQNQILSECVKNKDISETELHIIAFNKLKPLELVDFIKCRNMSTEKQIKIILIYLLMNNYNFTEFYGNKNPMLEILIVEFPQLKEYLERFTYFYFRTEMMSPNINSENKRDYYPKFADDIDIKLGYIPPFKHLLNDIYKKKLNEKNFPKIRESSDKTNIIVIYVSGGITLSEYKSTIDYIEKRRSENVFLKVYLVSDCILNYKKMLGRIIQ